MPYNREDLFTPQLPTELWREIFRIATYVPRLLVTSSNYWLKQCNLKYYNWDTIAHTRRAIVSVCSLWRTIGLEFMWEVIAIRNSGHSQLKLSRLADIFASSGYGRWTKRVDCHADLNISGNLRQFLRLLDTINALQILRFSKDDYNMGKRSETLEFYSILSERLPPVPIMCRGRPILTSHLMGPKNIPTPLHIPLYVMPQPRFRLDSLWTG